MLQTSARSTESASQSVLMSPADLVFRIIAIIRRNLLICLAVPAVFALLGIAYLMVTPPEFTATSVMVIDTRKMPTLQPGMNPAAESPLDNPTVESQVEIFKSENIALAVIRDLKLATDPDLNAPSVLGNLIGGLLSLVSAPLQPADVKQSEFQKTRRIVEQFQSRLSIRRVGVTFVFQIGFTHPNRERAAEIANAVAEAYVSDQLEAKYSTTKRAGSWLQDRLKELGKQASDAERAVVAFKSRNNIVNAGGRLLNEQQLSELNSQLATARANAGEAAAKLARIEEVMRDDVPDASVADALNNAVIINLRNQYTALSSREADLSARIGPDHEAVVNLRNDMREVRRSIMGELRRIAAGYRSDYEISKARLESIQASLTSMVSESQVANEAQVDLKELDSAAQSYRALYDSFLQRYMETVQQQSFPLTEARIVTRATPPLKKSHPRGSYTLLGAIFFGGLVAFAFAWMREFTDRTLKSPDSVEALLGIACISSVPLVKKTNGSKPQGKQTSQLCEVVTRPISRFAESIRAVKVAIDFFPSSRQAQVIGITSSLPGEGKTTIAANLAALCANSGSRAILIDGDLRSPSLTAHLAPDVKIGLVELLAGRSFEGVNSRLDDLGCDFIPAIRKGLGSNSNEFISSPAMRALLSQLKSRYDYIIVDLPPLLPVIDVRAAVDLFDCFVMVLEWSRTPSDSIQSALHMSSRIQMKTVGVVLNKVGVNAVRRLDNGGYPNAQHGYYTN